MRYKVLMYVEVETYYSPNDKGLEKIGSIRAPTLAEVNEAMLGEIPDTVGECERLVRVVRIKESG